MGKEEIKGGIGRKKDNLTPSVPFRQSNTMIKLEPFKQAQFDLFISWIDSKQLLVQIAGSYFTYPMTHIQLQQYLNNKNSVAFSIIEMASNKVIGHAEIILNDNKTCKIDKVIIGDKSNRGKGIGKAVIAELLIFCFKNLEVESAELNVYDWNTSAIKVYERVGFVTDQNKQMQTEVDGIIWKALNMKIDKSKWLLLQSDSETTLNS